MNSCIINIDVMAEISTYCMQKLGLTNGNTKDGIDQDIEWDDANKTVTIN